MCLQGLEIVFRIGLAVLHMKQTELIKLDIEGMMNVMKHSTEAKFYFSFFFLNEYDFEILPL